MNQPQQPKLNIDLKSTTPFVTEDGNHVFTEGIILRKVSKFLISSAEDGLIPVPCFVDLKTGKIAVDLLPKELRSEYQKLNEEIDKKNKIS